MSGFRTSWIWQIDTMLSSSYSDSIVNMMLKWVVTDNMCTLYMAVIRVKWLAVTMVTTVTQGQHKLGASLCKRQTTLRVSGWFLMFGSGRTLGWTLEGTGRCGSIVGFWCFHCNNKKNMTPVSSSRTLRSAVFSGTASRTLVDLSRGRIPAQLNMAYTLWWSSSVLSASLLCCCPFRGESKRWRQIPAVRAHIPGELQEAPG